MNLREFDAEHNRFLANWEGAGRGEPTAFARYLSKLIHFAKTAHYFELIDVGIPHDAECLWRTGKCFCGADQFKAALKGLQ